MEGPPNDDMDKLRYDAIAPPAGRTGLGGGWPAACSPAAAPPRKTATIWSLAPRLRARTCSGRYLPPATSPEVGRLPDLPERHAGCVHLRRAVRQRRAVREQQAAAFTTSPAAPGGCRRVPRTSRRPTSSPRPRRCTPSAAPAASNSAPASTSPLPTSAPRGRSAPDPAEAGGGVRLRPAGPVRRRERRRPEDHGRCSRDRHHSEPAVAVAPRTCSAGATSCGKDRRCRRCDRRLQDSPGAPRALGRSVGRWIMKALLLGAAMAALLVPAAMAQSPRRRRRHDGGARPSPWCSFLEQGHARPRTISG